MVEIEKTFAIIKPDAVRKNKAQEIMQLIELNGFTIIAKQKLQLTQGRAEEFYGEHKGKPFFPRLVDFMTSGPVWALVLAKPGAILAWRGLMGPTNVFTARAEKPKCLRALYGTDGTQNATHGSDSPASAAREIKFFFPNLSLDPVTNPAEAAPEYISAKLQPALAKALTVLARDKPSADKYEAITFLANYLLANNPNKPRIITPEDWDPSMAAGDDDDEAEFANARLVKQPTGDGEADVAARQEYAALLSAAKAPPSGAAAFAYAPEPGDAAPPPAKPPSRPASAAAPRAPTPPPPAAALAPRPPSGTPQANPAPRPTSRPGSASRPASAAPPLPPPPPAAAAPEPERPDPTAEELDAAATKVQAAYRGFQARKEISLHQAAARSQAPQRQQQEQQHEEEEEEAPPAEAAESFAEQQEADAVEEEPAARSGVIAEGMSYSHLTADEAEAAATRVQAHMRGHLARKQVAQLRAAQQHQQHAHAPMPEASASEQLPVEEASAREEDEQADQPEPEAEAEQSAAFDGEADDPSGLAMADGVSDEVAAAAATRVQAHMRGHLARKQVAAMRMELTQQQQQAAVSAEWEPSQAEPEDGGAGEDGEPAAEATYGEGEGEPDAEGTYGEEDQPAAEATYGEGEGAPAEEGTYGEGEGEAGEEDEAAAEEGEYDPAAEEGAE